LSLSKLGISLFVKEIVAVIHTRPFPVVVILEDRILRSLGLLLVLLLFVVLLSGLPPLFYDAHLSPV
jgi:hypothetical protein